jgi:ankyrin repeat protein
VTTTTVYSGSNNGSNNDSLTLTENAADPTAADKDGLTALMNAAEKGSVEVLKLIAAKVDQAHLDLKAAAGFNALIVAAAHGNLEAIDFLMGAGATVKDLADNSGVTPLMYAAANKKMDVVLSNRSTNAVWLLIASRMMGPVPPSSSSSPSDSSRYCEKLRNRARPWQWR